MQTLPGFNFSGGVEMSVLAEAISVVILRSVVEKRYPGGVRALAGECGSETFCADAHLLRVGFYSLEAAAFLAALLEASGLERARHGVAADFVLIDQNVGPLTQCLWLEFGRERDGTPVCWHAVGRRGNVQVPAGWRPEQGQRIGESANRPFARVVRFVKREDSTDWYHDRRSGRLIGLPAAFVAH